MAPRLHNYLFTMSDRKANEKCIASSKGLEALQTTNHPCSLGPEERQRLLTENLPEVRHIARRIHLRLPQHVLFDDLVHSGVLGLIDAVEKFDPARKVLLSAYARTRIRGAILDSLRELDWGPRLLRKRARHMERARNDLIAELGRLPSEPEVATRLGLRLDVFQHVLTDLACVSEGTQQARPGFLLDKERPAMRSDRLGEDPFQLIVRAESAAMLKKAIDTLTERERRALVLYYWEEHTMKQVGRVLRVRESRVSQIVTAALERLRKHMEERRSAPKRERQ